MLHTFRWMTCIVEIFLLKYLGITRGGCLIVDSLNQNHTQIIQTVNLFLPIGKKEP